MIHFSTNESEKTVYIHAEINTQRDPKEYWVKQKKNENLKQLTSTTL